MENLENRVVDYLTFTDLALQKIREILVGRDETTIGIKICIKQKGCSGLAYKIEYAERDVNISKHDEVIIAEGTRVFIDPKISLFIIGTTMDYVDEIAKSGFVFINPNEKGKCGCGESFFV